MTLRRPLTKEEQLDALLQEASTLKNETSSVEERMKRHRKLTIDGFIQLLYSLFKKRNMLIGQQEDSKHHSPVDPNRFVFTEIYPDYTTDAVTSNVVTFEVTKRLPGAFNSKAVESPEVQLHRPRVLYKERNINGHLIDIVEQYYDNELTLTIWSEKAEDARRLARFLENFMTAHYESLRMHVGVLVYKGRGRTIMSSDYGNKRLFGIPLAYHIRTEEPGYIIKGNVLAAEVETYLSGSDSLDEIEEMMQHQLHHR